MIIGSVKRYARGPHGWAVGLAVKIVAVHRDGEILCEDAAVGAPLPGDLIEFVPWIPEEDRFSRVTSDATIDQLEDL